jgi:hypothetical protein
VRLKSSAHRAPDSGAFLLSRGTFLANAATSCLYNRIERTISYQDISPDQDTVTKFFNLAAINLAKYCDNDLANVNLNFYNFENDSYICYPTSHPTGSDSFNKLN